MGVKFSQLPNATAVASEDYIAMLDTSAELLTKIPVGHASSNTVFGAGSTSEYGHNKVIDDLTKTSYAAGESLSAHQGNMLANDIGAFESSNTATVAHAAGEFFMWRSQFVKVTAAIAVGNTIATGVNVAATSISAVLGQLGQTVGFIGTTAEINAAIQSGAITEGMLVYNTDDEATQSITAGQISFNNSGTGMSATDVQSAITELNSDLAIKEIIATPVATYTNDIKVFKTGNIVQIPINIAFTAGTISAGATIATLPEGYRPKLLYGGFIFVPPSLYTTEHIINIELNGNISVQGGMGDATGLFGNIVYVAG